ncbi:MAG: transketolase [Deltaproteobacteria bacterium]|nr:transketolase [Deltaproteobacteria bacterium]
MDRVTHSPVGTHSSDVLVATLKTLAMDAVQKADSGHPGRPMGLADAASVLWADFLTTDPSDPAWLDRDRFVLSAGHGSMLIYGLLHLSGHDLSLDEIKRFRQLHSKTPGHPEHGLTPGVETTTGPLGQGFANAVGMAMAEAHLAARYNRGDLHVIDHMTWGICSDGDLQEGVAAEAASLAGHLGLGKLVFLYDDNGITIEGKTELAYSDDVPRRFEGYGWHVEVVDGHDRLAVHRALLAARAETARPSLVCCKTHIGHGSPNKQDTAASHGSPLGDKEIALTKDKLGWPAEPTFRVPDEAVSAFDALRARGALKRTTWQETMARYEREHPELHAELTRVLSGDGLPADLESRLPAFDDKPVATRVASGKVINALAPHVPQLWGGSADLAGSTKTLINQTTSFSRFDRAGRNLHFGIREHAMGAITNGMALHGGVIPYGATFLTFSDYMRGALRLAALMRQRVIEVFTHDSIFLGEDGPTHQSVEHAMALRLIPNMVVMRPGAARETAWAWLYALRRTDGPTSLLLTRQDLPGVPGTGQGLLRGGYIVKQADDPAIVLVGTGSELHLCVRAAEALAAEGLAARVVSLPSLEVFMAQPDDYRREVLGGPGQPRLVVEAGRTVGWEPVAGPLGRVHGLDRFGESAPAEVLAEHFGFTADHVARLAREVIAEAPARRAALVKELS